MSVIKKRMGGLRISYRPGGADAIVLNTVFTHNRYGFPDDMSDMVVIDIGAHIGSATMLCASRGATVFSFEPIRENYVLLERNVKANKLDAHVFQNAVGRPGARTIYGNPGNSASNGEYMLAAPTDNFFEEDVIWLTLGSIFANNNIAHCDFLKIDCEGSEIDVIPQIVDLRDQIDIVVGEIHSGMWPVPTPELDAMIDAAAASLDEFYTREEISAHEYRWRKKPSYTQPA